MAGCAAEAADASAAAAVTKAVVAGAAAGSKAAVGIVAGVGGTLLFQSLLPTGGLPDTTPHIAATACPPGCPPLTNPRSRDRIVRG